MTKKKKLYVLIKRKEDKIWMGANPVKENLTKKELKINLNENLPKNIQEVFVYKIVSEKQLLDLIIKQAPKE